MNQCIFFGRLVKDPELKNLPNGSPYAKFTLAVSERRKSSKDKEWKEHTEFVNCIIWGSRAEVISKYCLKGSSLLVKGKFTTTKYNEKYYTSINVDDFNFASPPAQKAQNAPSEPQQNFNPDDIPF